MKDIIELKERVPEETIFIPDAEKVYRKFPFFVGYEVKLKLGQEFFQIPAIDLIASLANVSYGSQSLDNQKKPIERFWDADISLVSLCCKFIAKTLVNDPARYSNRKKILPTELNDVIDEKLKKIDTGIAQEKVTALFVQYNSTVNQP